jgi:hypothetical protein
MPLVSARLVPHLAEVLRHPEFKLVAVGPVPLAHWQDNLRPAIERIGGEWLCWCGPIAGSLCAITDLPLTGHSATHSCGGLVEALAETQEPGDLQVSLGWWRAAERMAKMLGGIAAS